MELGVLDDDDLEIRRVRSTRLIGLALPFGLIGAHGGWVVSGLLAGPLLFASPRDVPPVAAGSGTLAGAACGLVVLFLVRRRLSRGFDAGLFRALLLTVPLAGMAVGWATDALTVAHDLLVSLAFGAAGALALLPLCWLVARAMLRACRARHGSLVAAADRRSIGCLTVVALTATSFVELHRWAFCDHSWPPVAAAAELGGRTALVVAALATLAVAAIHRADRIARRRLEDLAKRLEGVEPSEGELMEDAVGLTDLGLGDDRRIERVDGGSAYRHGTRAVAEVVGDLDAAAGAIAMLARRSRWVLVGATLVLTSHLVGFAIAPSPPLKKAAQAFRFFP
jgi:hypothetical protein